MLKISADIAQGVSNFCFLFAEATTEVIFLWLIQDVCH